MLAFRRLRLSRLRSPNHLSLRRQSTQPQYEPPSAPPQKPSQHANFYKVFGRPIAKNFLIAVAVYQAIYWSWIKLESMEVKQEKEGEMRRLQGEIEGMTGAKLGRKA